MAVMKGPSGFVVFGGCSAPLYTLVYSHGKREASSGSVSVPSHLPALGNPGLVFPKAPTEPSGAEVKSMTS